MKTLTLTLKYKLFLSILFLLLAAIGSMVLLLQQSFDRTFLQYVNKYEREAQRNLIDNLGDLYHMNGSWEFIQNNQDLWNEVVASNFARAKHTRSNNYEEVPQQTSNDPLFTEQPDPDNLSRREKRFYRSNVALLDATRRHVVGLEDIALEGTEFVPITSDHDNRDVVGFLAARPLARILETPDIEFSNQQLRGLNIIAVAIAILTFIMSIPLARYLVSRINTIAVGTRELAVGNYNIRIPARSRDELGKLSNDFNMLARTLEENEKARSQWIADISHELRTPLAILRGEVEAIQDKIRTLTPETLDNIHSEVMNLDRLVKDLYELSMSDIGALSYHKKELNLLDTLGQTISVYRESFDAKHIKLILDWPESKSYYILADPDRMAQLFSNLMTNSLHYTEEDGVLEISVRASGRNVVIEFGDSKPSVFEQDMVRLFDRLYRVEASRNRYTGGTGLGLAICKNIVEAHQGSVHAANSAHGGLQIHLEFPLVK